MLQDTTHNYSCTLICALPILCAKPATAAIIKEIVTFRVYVSLYTIAQYARFKTNQSNCLNQNIKPKLVAVFGLGYTLFRLSTFFKLTH